MGSSARINEWKRERRAEFQRRLDTIKLAAGCMDCGYAEYARALQFDHVRGEKAFTISVGLQHRSWENILTEVAKCDVRCANCHALVTQARLLGP